MILQTKYGDITVTSPFDVFTYFIELPPLKSDHVEGAVRFRLRSMHPGDPLATKVDIRKAAIRSVRPHKKLNNSVWVIAHVLSVTDAVTIMNEETIAHGDAHTTTDEALIPGSSLLATGWLEYVNSKAPIPQTIIGVLVSPDWIQCICYRDGIAIAGTSCKNQTRTGLSSTLASALLCIAPYDKADEPYGLYVVSLPNADASSINPPFGYSEPFSIPLEHVLNRIHIDRERLFNPSRKKRPQIRRILISSLVALNLILAENRLVRVAASYETEAETLKRTYEKEKSASFEILELQKELERLVSSDTASVDSVGLDAYEVFERLSINMPTTTIDSFTLQGSSIKFTARSSDALSCIEKLQSDPFFADISLIQAIPSHDGGEILTVSGRIE